ncbi:MAG: hypothetical protein IJW64_03875 [Clostridia bacterium]|nr:hypothetical protein [Clostridia bacterium]
MRKKFKLIYIALCAVVALCFGAFGTIAIHSALADEVDIIFEDYSFEEEYVYGDTIVVPAPSKVKLQKGQMQTQAVSVVLSFPDGATKSEGSYVLDKVGKYKLAYYNANGLSAVKEFSVDKYNYGITQGSTAVFDETLVNKTDLKGVSVTLKDEGSFTFNKAINLYDYEGSSLDVCTIFPLFRTGGSDEPIVTTVSVKLVDLYDESKFVEFYIWCPGESEKNGAYYLGAGASTQILTGLEYNENRKHEMTEEYDGGLCKIHRPQRYQPNTAWGRAVNAHYNADLISGNGISLVWDLSNQQMKVSCNKVTQIVTDIDSSQIYGVNTFDFKSFFTTGEVCLNVSAYNYSATYFDFALSQVFGYTQDELDNAKIDDKQNPEVFVDVDTTEKGKIYLQKNVEFTLPQISQVIDHNYYGNYNLSVYRNYKKTGQVLVNVDNGKFTPTALGCYSAVYTATDAYGNQGNYVLEMVVLDKPNMSYEKTKLSKLVGAKVNVIPSIEIVGINKPIQTEVFVTDPNGTVSNIYYNGVDGYDYIPKQLGSYTITYNFKDNVYSEEFSYDLTCVDENSVIFDKPFSFPSYFIKGNTYSIGEVNAYLVGNEGFEKKKATVSVSVDGGEFKNLTDSQLEAYKVEADDTLQFKATYNGQSILSKSYKVIDVGFGKVTTEKDYIKYMQGNYSDSALTENGAKYVFSDSDAKMQFINKISNANFGVKFNLSATQVEKIEITLRDAQNPDGDYVCYVLEKGSSSTIQISISQYRDFRMTSTMVVPSKYTKLNGNFVISQTNLGIDFDGLQIDGIKSFEKDDVLLEMGVVAQGGCEITVSQINNQEFTVQESMRESKPQLKFQSFNGVTEVGVNQEISTCYSSAVLGSVLLKDVKVTVYNPDGEVVTSTDGVRLENVKASLLYTIRLEKVGQYRVEYSTSLIGANKVKTQTTLKYDDYYVINVSESQAPEIKFKDGANTQTTVKLKVGAKHTVKEFTVTDNVSSGENIKVYTMILDKYFTLEENGYGVSEYKFNRAGEYIVYVLAYDEFGNSSSLYYNVVVA